MIHRLLISFSLLSLLGLLALPIFPLQAEPLPSPAPSVSPDQPSPLPLPTATPTPEAEPTPSASPTPLPPRLSTRELINGLSPEDVSHAIETLQKDFLDPTKTDAVAVQRATLEGLVRQLSPGAAVRDAAHNSIRSDDTPFLAEILDSHIAYIRLGVLSADSLAQFDATLAGSDSKAIDAIILDLRGVPPGGSFEIAADFARRLCTKGKLLFSLQKPIAKQERIFTSNQDPTFQGVLIVLTDPNTSGPAEALAGTLRLNSGAMIIGTDTTGEAVEFRELPLGKKAVLQIAIAQVILPETGPIFPDGIKPDIAISLPAAIQEYIFHESTESGVSQFVFESARRHMNEASLVANRNPEIDAARSAMENKDRPPKIRDTVLQRAVDLVTAINFYRARPQP